MTDTMMPLGAWIQTAHKSYTFERLCEMLRASAPLPLTINRPAQTAAFRVTFYDPANSMRAFVSVEVNFFAGAWRRWRETMPQDLWPIKKHDLGVWLEDRLCLRVPRDLTGQVRVLEQLRAIGLPEGEREKVEESALEKYDRMRGLSEHQRKPGPAVYDPTNPRPKRGLAAE